MATPDIDSVLKEHRVFPPPAEFASAAHVRSLADYERLYQQSIDDPERFWARHRRRARTGSTPWTRVLDWKPPDAKWFVGGTTNLAYNCLDRHLDHLAPQQGGDHLGGRAGRRARAHLRRAAPRGVPVRRRR